MCFHILCCHIKSVTAIQLVFIEATYMKYRLKLQTTLNISQFQKTFCTFGLVKITVQRFLTWPYMGTQHTIPASPTLSERVCNLYLAVLQKFSEINHKIVSIQMEQGLYLFRFSRKGNTRQHQMLFILLKQRTLKPSIGSFQRNC